MSCEELSQTQLLKLSLSTRINCKIKNICDLSGLQPNVLRLTFPPTARERHAYPTLMLLPSLLLTHVIPHGGKRWQLPRLISTSGCGTGRAKAREYFPRGTRERGPGSPSVLQFLVENEKLALLTWALQPSEELSCLPGSALRRENCLAPIRPFWLSYSWRVELWQASKNKNDPLACESLTFSFYKLFFEVSLLLLHFLPPRVMLSLDWNKTWKEGDRTAQLNHFLNLIINFRNCRWHQPGQGISFSSMNSLSSLAFICDSVNLIPWAVLSHDLTARTGDETQQAFQNAVG